MKLSFEDWSAVLARVESGGNPESWGDDGRACGRWQMHPPFVQQWRLGWSLGMTWDEVFRQCLLHFWAQAKRRGVDDVDAAVGFHLHGQPNGSQADALPYAARFRQAAQALGIAL